MIIQQELATAYQILAHLKYDDHTYTHLSARDASQQAFYIYPFGLRFEEVTADCLMQVSFDGTVLVGNEYQYNKTGYMIHGAIYQQRPDVQAIFHLHTPATLAVSALAAGLLPISQWALHFYERICYYDYGSLALSTQQGEHLAQALGTHSVMLLRNHGFITCGRTIHEAMFYTYHLQRACETQCQILSMGLPYITPDPATCKQAVHDLLSFEKNLGERDWHAWKRLVKADY
ncbi:MAG TPA: class II aldolase/adducin family protein [Gammaproteobacteria bacterium]|nr:class II aldolase/adducin family protein [Gammaproteobacteria bacterium]